MNIEAKSNPGRRAGVASVIRGGKPGGGVGGGGGSVNGESGLWPGRRRVAGAPDYYILRRRTRRVSRLRGRLAWLGRRGRFLLRLEEGFQFGERPERRLAGQRLGRELWKGLGLGRLPRRRRRGRRRGWGGASRFVGRRRRGRAPPSGLGPP